MKFKLFLIVVSFALSANAAEKVTDIFFFPEENQVAGFTGFKTSTTEYTATILSQNLKLSSNPTDITQSFGIGLSSGFAVRVILDYLQDGSAELQIGASKTKTDYKKKLQSPSFLIGKKVILESGSLEFIIASLQITPKGSDDDASSSDYIGAELRTGSTLNSDLKFGGVLNYVSYNATDSIESRNAMLGELSLQKEMNQSVFVVGSIAYVTLSDEKYKNSTDKFKYDPYFSLKASLGYTKEGSNLDWLFSYSLSSSKFKYVTGGASYGGDGNNNVISFGVGYKL